ncbi:MAG TPA: TetR/AcrR family transcriptional regulator [Aquamicrobium sp.]|nr:TetR/AcrR family transcriptional regulator [Aquamicrobium sp.]
MARNRSFDEKEVLGRAMHAFRRHGYARISIRQLEEATGLTSGSLYNAYRDKDGLYRAALAHYVDSFVVARLRTHAGPEATLDDLEELFLTLFRPPLTDGFGCMVSNAAMEFGSSGSVADESVARALDLVDASLHAVLAREIGPEAARPVADRLALIYQGILLMTRAGRAGGRHEEAIRDEFRRLKEARIRFRAGDTG